MGKGLEAGDSFFSEKGEACVMGRYVPPHKPLGEGPLSFSLRSN